jgi:hypothetical protein
MIKVTDGTDNLRGVCREHLRSCLATFDRTSRRPPKIAEEEQGDDAMRASWRGTLH